MIAIAAHHFLDLAGRITPIIHEHPLASAHASRGSPIGPPEWQAPKRKAIA
jgi:hypothetical protein